MVWKLSNYVIFILPSVILSSIHRDYCKDDFAIYQLHQDNSGRYKNKVKYLSTRFPANTTLFGKFH